MIPESTEPPGSEVLAAALGVLRRRPRDLPVVTATWAQSTAGAIGTREGKPLALSGPESMVLTHRLRAAHDAILVGITTVISDDPLLSVRLLPGAPRQPQPVVLDSRLRFPLSARLLARKDRVPWIFCSDARQAQAELLTQSGARIFRVGTGPGGVDLYETLLTLRREGIESVMVEGGASVLRAFLASGFAEQVVVTISPSTVQGLEGPDLPAFLQSVSEKVGRDTVTWGSLNP